MAGSCNGYSFFKRGYVSMCNWPGKRSGEEEKKGTYPPTSICICLLGIDYAASATLDKSLKQGCHNISLPCFSAFMSAPEGWKLARGLAESESCLLLVDFIPFYNSSCKCQVAAQPPVNRISEHCWLHWGARLVSSPLAGGSCA